MRLQTLTFGVAALVVLAATPTPVTTIPAHLDATPAASTGAWTVYHRDNGHTGNDPTLPPISGASTGWTSAVLDGQIYAEPLVYNGFVYTATLNNTVYSIDQATGLTKWSNHLGTPQASGWICGNVAPMGILGTPVIDTAASRIYAVAEIAGATPTYHLFGLDLTTGGTMLDTPIAPTGFDWKIQQERGALVLANGYVYVPFGGRAGDCFDGGTPYYGWVVGVPTSGIGLPNVYRTPSGAESVWAPGGVVVDDTSHNVFFATGNAIPCAGSTYSDAIVRVSPTLTSPSFFEPSDWQANWCGPDSDLGSASPMLISPNLMFTAGKRGGGFLLDPTNLGGVNGQLYPPRVPYQQAEVCLGDHSGATFGSFAYAAPFIYVECDGNGLVALSTNTSTPSFSPCNATCGAPDWHAGGSTTFGPPIVAGGAVWVADISGSGLYAFNATTGAQMFHSAAFGVNHFVTPAEAGGQVFVPSLTVIRSFKMSFLSWTSLNGTLTSGPDASSWGAPRVDVFARGANNGIWQNIWTGTSWAGWSDLGGVLTSNPGAVSWGPNRIDLFARGTDNALYHRWWDGTNWYGWEWLGGNLTAGPDASSWGVGRLDIFARGPNSGLLHKWWDGRQWSSWEDLGGILTTDPTAVSWGPNRIDVFALSTNNGLWHKWWDGSRWNGWESLGGALSSAPDVTSCSADRLDVVALGTDHALWRKSWNGSQWGAWQSVGGQWTSDPSAVCEPATATVDLFARGADLAIWHTTVTGS